MKGHRLPGGACGEVACEQRVAAMASGGLPAVRDGITRLCTSRIVLTHSKLLNRLILVQSGTWQHELLFVQMYYVGYFAVSNYCETE